MPLTLPLLVIAAAVLYFIARHEGWFDAIARRRDLGGGRTGKVPRPGGTGRGRVPRERLEVFEEFLSSLGRDETEDPR